MGVKTSAKAKLFIGAVADSNVDTVAEFEALSLQEVGLIETIGEFGDEANQITFTALNDRRVQKFKGSFDAGNVLLGLGRDLSDAGQAALKAAQALDFDYAIKIELNDGSSGSPSQNTTFYFRAQVMSFKTNIGSAEDITRASADLGINSEILEIERV